MSEAPEHPPLIPPPTGQTGWSARKLAWITAFILAAQIGFIFLFGTRHLPSARPVTDAPQLEIARPDDPYLALLDPTLFVLPHANDFGAALWKAAPELPPTPWREAEPSGFLTLDRLPPAPPAPGGAPGLAPAPEELKPAPLFAEPGLAPEPVSPGSTLELAGNLANRPLLNPPALPVLEYNDVLPPSRVQVLVDAAGLVSSLVLLPPNNLFEARERPVIGDTNALRIARNLRFAPGPDTRLGEIVFHWRTTPLRTP